MTSMSRWGVALVAVMLLGGCAHTQKVPPAWKDEPYRVGREDVLDVSVWHNADLSRVLPVRPDGFITLPLVGEVAAAGRTTDQLEAEIRQKLKPYVQDPRVAVIVHEVNSSRVYVTGEVAHPGAFALRGRMSVLQAIALAGGFSDFADRGEIKVVRREGNTEVYPVDYDALVDGEEAARADFWLKPGDTVVVP